MVGGRGCPARPRPTVGTGSSPASRVRLRRVEATPVVCRGCPVLQCLCGPFPIPGWSRVAFWWEVWFSSLCLLRTLATKAMVLAINGSPILGGCRPLEKTIFGSLPAPRLNGARSGVRKDVTRLLPVFRTRSPRRYSDSSPGAHSHFGVTYLACRPRDAMARVNCHANVDSMYESFRFPYRHRSRWDLESMFHSRLLPKFDAFFLVRSGL